MSEKFVTTNLIVATVFMASLDVRFRRALVRGCSSSFFLQHGDTLIWQAAGGGQDF